MTAERGRPVLRGLRIADPPDRWRAIGFTVQDAELRLGDVAVELRPDEAREPGIVGWTLHGIEPVDSIDGLSTQVTEELSGNGSVDHENGALAIDHVVVTTPDFSRTAEALGAVGLELRRVREAAGGIRQGFRRLGQAILELVELHDAPDPSASARFWGLVVTVNDLDALAEQLGEHLSEPKPAVQPGRRIATLRPSAGLSPAVAFMTPEG